MGDVSGQSLSAIPASDWLGYCWQILQNHEQVGVASAGVAEADRGRAPPDESLESKGKLWCRRSLPATRADHISQLYHGDRFHLMPIITPAYPSMCATHNISMSTKTVLLRELQRGGDIVDKIFAKQLSWNDLFTRHSFFTQDYKYYLSITASSKTKEAESIWSGLVESKLRHLVGALDRKPIIAVAHPFPKGFERVHLVTNDQAMEAVKNGSTQYQAVGTKTEMTDETKNAAHEAAARSGVENAELPELAEQKKPENDGQTVYTTTYYIGLELKPLEPGTIPASCVLFAATNLS